MENKYLISLHKIDKLHPTQFCVGQLEINSKLKLYSKLSSKELNELMIKKSVPLVLGPDQISYMIDRHHNVTTFLQMGISEVFGHYIANLSHLTIDDFIKVMRICKWTWLYNQNYQELEFPKLPKHVSHLVNDPYRGLMYLLREDKVLNKDESVPFIEFFWAQQIRAYIPNLSPDEISIHKAYLKVLELLINQQLVIKDADLIKAKELYNRGK